MAVGVQEHTVFRFIRTAPRAPGDVVVVPASDLRDLLTANRAEAVLLLPQSEELPTTVQVLCHSDAKALLEVEFPPRIEGIGFSTDQDMPTDRNALCVEELPFFSVVLAVEHPMVSADRLEVLALDPAAALVGMATDGPLPECFEDC